MVLDLDSYTWAKVTRQIHGITSSCYTDGTYS